MNEEQSGIEWFDTNVKPLLGNNFELKYVNENGGDLGDLSGVQFDSDKKGGYIYFWSLGYIGFQLVDYEKEIELVEDTTEEVKSRSYNEVFSDLILKLK